MAEQADGSIIVDTEIDTKGFKAGSKELHNAIKSLKTKIVDLRAQIANFGETKVPTDEYKALTAQCEKAEQALFKLYDRQDKMKSTGVKENSKQWQSLQYDIQLAKEELERFEAEKASLENSGKAYEISQEYINLQAALAKAKDKLSEITSVGARTHRTIIAIKDGLVSLGKTAAKAVGSTCKKTFASALNVITPFKKSLNSSENIVGKLGKKINGVWSMFKRLAIRKVLSSILSGMKEGMDNLARYSSDVNTQLSALKSGTTQLKNSFATMVAPLLNVVMPILTMFIDKLNAVTTKMAQFAAALSGKNTFTKAKAVQEDYAASLDGTSKAAKKAQKQLAGFDDLNVLNTSDSDSGVDVSKMFEEASIDSNVTSFIGRLKDAFKNGEYGEIGKIIGNKLNEQIEKLKERLNPTSINKTVNKVLGGIAEGFNNFVHTVDWEQVGDTVAQGFDIALNALFTVATAFDWPALASSLVTSLNGLIAGIDWAFLGVTLTTMFVTLLQTLRSAVTTFDWAGLGDSIAEFINNIDWPTIIGEFVGFVSDVIFGALNLLTELAENIDWEKLGNDLWDSLVEIVDNIDWVGIVEKAFELLGAVIAGAALLIATFAMKAWEAIKEGFEEIKTKYFEPYMNDMGELTIEGFFNGILDMLKDIGIWIKEHIFDPFIKGFKKAFGIASPSKEMEDMGGYIIDGLLKGLKGTWSSITGWFGNTVKDATTWGKDMMSNMSEGISKAKNKVHDAVSGVANGIKDFLGFSEPEKGPLSDFHTYMPDMLELMASGINKNKGVAIKAVSDIASSISEEIQNGDYTMSNIGTDGLDASLDSFSDKIVGGFNKLIERLSAIANGVTFAVPAVASGAVVPYYSSADTPMRHGDPRGTGPTYSALLERIDRIEAILGSKLDRVVDAIDEKETGITDADIYQSVKSSARKEEKATGRSAF